MINRLPKILPIFPLENILFLPNVNLPLYIFEDRYLNMVNDAIKTNKLIGMVQIINSNNVFKEVFKIGCAGKIVYYEKTPDKKIHLILNCFSRFKIKKELSIKNGYRRIIPNWEIFLSDHKKDNVSKLDKEILLQSIENNIKTLNINFFKKQLTKISANEIIQIVSRELAFSNIENQSLIEIQNCSKRINFLIKLIKNLLISNESQSLH